MQFHLRLPHSMMLPLALTTLVLTSVSARAQTVIYSPIALPASREINDILII
jgi:hypothetical protein